LERTNSGKKNADPCFRFHPGVSLLRPQLQQWMRARKKNRSEALYFVEGEFFMRFAGYWLVVLCAVSMMAGAQEHSQHSEHPDASIQGKIVALEKLWNQAYKSGDTKALDALLDDSIVLINDDGSVQSKSQFLASVKAPNAQEQQVAPESMKVNVHGDVAIATGVLRVKGVQKGRVYVRRESYVDTWLQKGATWVCIATNATPITY
jgi:ketosteroid isomerase-like protein